MEALTEARMGQMLRSCAKLAKMGTEKHFEENSWSFWEIDR
jgi:hypothetical protein